MKIFIVTKGEYSDYHIEEVFTNKEKAELYAKCHYCEVEEWDTSDDIIISPCKQLVCKCTLYNYMKVGNGILDFDYVLSKNPMESFKYSFKYSCDEYVANGKYFSGGTIYIGYRLPEDVTENNLNIEKYKKDMEDVIAKLRYELSQGATREDLEKLEL